MLRLLIRGRAEYNIFGLMLLILITLCGCSAVPNSDSYRSMYAHLNHRPVPQSTVTESDYFLVILVDARHLDYTNNHSFFKTVAKHPCDGSKNGDVGHAWIYLQGIHNGELTYLEGGHSGESGCIQARYFDGMMNYIDYGYANPSDRQRECPRYEPNPIKYFWESQYDGFFQWGSGNHRPTYAAKVNLNPEQFNRIWSFIENFPYSEYSVVRNQCASFATQVASIAGLELECDVTIAIDPFLCFGENKLRFWTDPYYANLTVSSPDIVECSLMQAVDEGRAEYALDWYRETYPESWKTKVKNFGTNVSRFPKRLSRYLNIR